MAAVVTEETVESSAGDGVAAEGRAILAGGGVSGVASSGYGFGGTVRDAGGATRTVWVGIAGRRLAADCDGPCGAPGDGLCRHAVALALDAVAKGLEWRATPAHADPAGDVYEALRPEEKGQVLDQLLAARTELRAAAITLARRLLLPQAAGGLAELQERTAAAVETALRELDIADLHAGYQPGGGNVDEYEAAGHLVSDVLAPFEEDVRRRLALGFMDAAEAVALGMLDGLDACDGEDGEYDGDEVLCYAGEGLAENYGDTVRALLRNAGREPD